MSSLSKLKKSILADGVIDEAEVKQLREVLYADGKIDKEEAEFLFELNDAVSGKDNHSTWETLFIEAITSFLLEDETSPGEIDDEEAKWLLAKIQGDGRLDKTERALLNNLKKKVKVFPKILNL
ncbi:MAG: TerB family tellurite resistance protein [Candidatus Azobacteroides sp.]|nr:TerB family tellurite resistance protein [Candidatus Azobacteroides sp.]